MNDMNILVILTDQWRAECFGFKGHPIVKTQNIDALARISCNFTNSHTITPLCSPARGCLLTSLPPNRNGVLDNLYVGASTQKPLNGEVDTWLKAAARKGMNTAYFGKWHLGEWDAAEMGVDTDIYSHELSHKPKAESMATARGELVQGAVTRKNEAWKAEEHIDGNKLPYYGLRKDAATSPDAKACKNVLEFLRHSADTPWCVTASFRSPHFPLYVPEPYYSMYDYREMELPDSFDDHFANKPWFQNRHWWPSMNTDRLTREDWQKTIASYYGLISYVDHLCGEVIKAAKENSGGRPTLCIFTSDHGEMMGSHSRFDKGAYFYDEVMRTPLLICEDLKIAQPCVNERKEYCSSSDIAATLFTVIGKTPPAGRDLLALMHGSSEQLWPQEAFGAYHKYNGHSFEVRCITTPHYKYSYVPQDIDELYDLDKDPQELINVADDDTYRVVKENLRNRLFKHLLNEQDYIIQDSCGIPSAGEFCPDYPVRTASV